MKLFALVLSSVFLFFVGCSSGPSQVAQTLTFPDKTQVQIVATTVNTSFLNSATVVASKATDPDVQVDVTMATSPGKAALDVSDELLSFASWGIPLYVQTQELKGLAQAASQIPQIPPH